MGEIISYGKSKMDALLSQLRTDSDNKYALKSDIPAPSSGGGFGGVTMATPALKQESVTGSGKRLWFADFSFAPYLNGKPGPTLVNHPSTDWGGICFAEAGWYQISAQMQVQFDPGANANLPEAVNFNFSEYNATSGFFADVPCSPGTESRGMYGAEAMLTSHIFYQEGEDVTTNRPIKFYLDWSTDAVASYPYLRLYVAKLG